MPEKTTIDHLFIFPNELAHLGEVCDRAIREQCWELAAINLVNYQECLVRVIKDTLTTGDGQTQRVYDPETQEISPNVYDDFDRGLRVHIATAMAYIGALLSHQDEQVLWTQNELSWFATHYPLLCHRYLGGSHLAECKIPEKELKRREREKDRQKTSDASAAKRKEWAIFGSAVLVQCVSMSATDPSGITLTASVLRMVAEVAATTILGTSAAVADDAVRGKNSWNSTLSTAANSAAHGAVASAIAASCHFSSALHTSSGTSQSLTKPLHNVTNTRTFGASRPGGSSTSDVSVSVPISHVSSGFKFSSTATSAVSNATISMCSVDDSEVEMSGSSNPVVKSVTLRDLLARLSKIKDRVKSQKNIPTVQSSEVSKLKNQKLQLHQMMLHMQQKPKNAESMDMSSGKVNAIGGNN